MEVSNFKNDILLAEACHSDVDKFCNTIEPGACQAAGAAAGGGGEGGAAAFMMMAWLEGSWLLHQPVVLCGNSFWHGDFGGGPSYVPASQSASLSSWQAAQHTEAAACSTTTHITCAPCIMSSSWRAATTGCKDI